MPRTLKLGTPNYKQFFLIILLLVIQAVTAEFLIRALEPNPILGVPSIGSNYKEFEARLTEFDRYAAERSTIDCVFLGDSTAMTNFAPLVFADAYRDQTGKDIECFNFGAGAFTIADSAALAQILIQEKPPKLLILGVEALSFAVPADASGDVDMTELPWTQYKLGRFSIIGWLYEHSRLVSRLGAISQLITLQTSPAEMRRQTLEANSALKEGFYPMEGPGPFDISEVPDPTSDHPYHENYFGSLSNFQLLPEHLEALDQIIGLNSVTTQVVIVEMPVPKTFYYYFGKDEQDYQTFVKTVEQHVSGTTVPFFRAEDLNLFPTDLWLNYNHLNARGAPIFSYWFGTQLGQAELNGDLSIVTNS
jgi:hypothetical protein